MQVNFYYDWSGELTSDTEGNLVQLCRSCAAKQAECVEWASRGHDQGECEVCRASNDPDYSRQLDELMREY